MKKIFIIVIIIIILLFNSTRVFATLDGYAVCFGLDETAYNTTTRWNQEANSTNIVNDARNMYASMGYTAYKYVNPTFTRFQSFLSDNATRMLEADIVLISGHASPT